MAASYTAKGDRTMVRAPQYTHTRMGGLEIRVCCGIVCMAGQTLAIGIVSANQSGLAFLHTGYS